MTSKVLRRMGLGGLMVLSLAANSTVAQPVFASIPEALRGFYTLEMTNATPFSPIRNTSSSNPSDDILLYVTAYGELCTKNILSGTVQLLSSTSTFEGPSLSTVRWDIPGSGLSFLLNINQSPFTGFDLQSTGGDVFGRLVGAAPANDTGSCGTPPFDTSLSVTMYNLAETAYPTFFPSSAFTYNQIGSGYDVFRYYPSTDIYLAVRGEAIYARGGDFGDEFIVIGDVTDAIDDISTMLMPNRIPAFYQGTYLLELTDTQPFSPLADATQLNFVVTGTGQLCVGELALSFPTISGNTAIWTNSNGNLRYTLDLTRDDDPATFLENLATGEFSFQSLSGRAYGLFSGDKTSLSTDCLDAQGTSPDLTDINTLFGLIEQKYPTLFPSGPQTYNQKTDGFTYRYYFDSQVFVAVKNGVVYVNGGQFGNCPSFVPFDTLANVLAQLTSVAPNETSIIPASSAGTYAMSFSSATPYSPFIDGTTAQVILDANGSLCIDGAPLGRPYALATDPNMAFWANANTGLRFGLDISALSETTMSLGVTSTIGQTLSTLSGDRISLTTGCESGAAGTDRTLANQLFTLAEQNYSSLFPASALTVTQSEVGSNALLRYYPGTQMTLHINGETVSVKGGDFGPSLVTVGQLGALITQIGAVITPVYDLRVTGNGQVVKLQTVIRETIDIKRYALTRPNSSDLTALEALVEASLSDLREIDSVSISITSDTASQLVFTAQVVSNTTLLGITTLRNYSLTFTLTQR